MKRLVHPLMLFVVACLSANGQTPPVPAPRPTPAVTITPTPTPTPTPAPTPTVTATAKPIAKADGKAKLSGAEISEARDLLGALGFWVVFAEEQKGGRIEQNQQFDTSMRHALIAFQKIAARPRTGLLTTEELQALRTAQRHQPLEAGYAHIEVDLVRQVLLLVDSCGACLRILPISSGSGEEFTEGGRTRRAVTPVGRFTVQRKIAGWRKSPLGLLYYPNYFLGGYAIHGNPAVPAQPASHGCIRIPMFAAKELYEVANIGLPILIYDEKPLPPRTPLAIAKPIQEGKGIK